MSRELEPEANQLRRQSFELVKQAIFEAGLSETVHVSSFSSSMDSGKLSDELSKEDISLGRRVRAKVARDRVGRITQSYSMYSNGPGEFIDIFYSDDGGVVAISKDRVSSTVYLLGEGSGKVDFSDPLALQKVNSIVICMAPAGEGRDGVVATYKQQAEVVEGGIVCSGVRETSENLSFPVSFASLYSEGKGTWRSVSVYKDPDNVESYTAYTTQASPTLKTQYEEDKLSLEEAMNPGALLCLGKRTRRMREVAESEVRVDDLGNLISSTVNHESRERVDIIFGHTGVFRKIIINGDIDNPIGKVEAVVQNLPSGEALIQANRAGRAFLVSDENLILEIYPIRQESPEGGSTDVSKALAFLKEVQGMLEGLELPSDFSQIRDINIPQRLIGTLAADILDETSRGGSVSAAKITINGTTAIVELVTTQVDTPFETLSIHYNSQTNQTDLEVLLDEGEPYVVIVSKPVTSEHITSSFYTMTFSDDDLLQVTEFGLVKHKGQTIDVKKEVCGEESTTYSVKRKDGYISVKINGQYRYAETFEKGPNGPILKRYSIATEVDLSTPQAAIEYVNGELDDKHLTVEAWKNDIYGISTCIAHLDGEIITLKRFSLPSSRVTYEVNGEYCTPFDGEDGLKCLRAESGKTYYYIENHKLGVIELIAPLEG